MNKLDFPQEFLDGLTSARGRLHVIDRLIPEKTALLVIDMQNFFVEQGQALEVPAARKLAPNINRLAQATRNSGGTVIWVQMTLNDADLDHWSVFLPANGSRERFQPVADGEYGHQIWREMAVKPEDLIVQKRRFSAFIQGSSDLHKILQERGIDTLIITGTLTNVCCESTARDAMMLNYRILMVADANATLTEEAHRAALMNILFVFGDVQSTEDVLKLLEQQ
ncbi:MAG: Isochorismatase protein [Gammaproteobacteria bacterium]|nr:Isochorismatase protein [Gammaproteobacteria bacterium]